MRAYLTIGWMFVVLGVSGCIPMKNEYGETSRPMYVDQISLPVHLPINAPSISQLFWRFAETKTGNERRSEHLGIDITAQKDTAVIAPYPGEVVSSFFEPTYGNRIVLDHCSNADGLRVQTSYWHLNRRDVEPGDKVMRGQVLGGLGNTGVLASGILHVHFAVLVESPSGRMEPVDPSTFWSGGKGKVECFIKGKYWSNRTFAFTYPVMCSPRK